ncbi:MAG: hypothetical protein JO006_15430 [Paucibacter sp.]|nr:hypothetical protein [Roseateles sp.]
MDPSMLSGSGRQNKRQLGQQRFDKWILRRPPSTFRTSFASSALDALEKDKSKGGLNRGILKGLGKFKVLIDAARALNGAEGTEKEEKRARALIALADDYLAKREDDSEEDVDDGKGKDKDKDKDKPDKVTERKLELARQMRDQALALLHDLRDEERERDEKQLGGYAQSLIKDHGFSSPSGGTSEVHLVKDGHGGIAYAFKTVQGESTQSGLQPGGGAVREALSSTLAQEIMAQTGLDFGFPKVQIVSMDVPTRKRPQGGAELGALVEGLKGDVVLGPEGQAQKNMDLNEEMSEYASKRTKLKKTINERKQAGKDASAEEAEVRAINDEMAKLEDKLAELPEKFERLNTMARELPAKDLQKIALCFMMSANCDLKWENMMIDRDPKGRVTARPFDGGAAFMTDEAFNDQNDRNDGGGALAGMSSLLVGPDGLPMDSVGEPMDREVVKQILDIDVNLLAARLEEEQRHLVQQKGLEPSLLDPSGIRRSVESIRLIQKILSEAPKDTSLAALNDTFVRLANQDLAPGKL